ENFTVSDYGSTFVGRREVESLGFTEGDEFFLVLLRVHLDIDDDFAVLPAGSVELPESEVVLVNNRFAVGGDAGEKEVAVAVIGDPRLLAALVGDLPDVVDALHHFRSAELDP